jgi:hypothetical protein
MTIAKKTEVLAQFVEREQRFREDGRRTHQARNTVQVLDRPLIVKKKLCILCGRSDKLCRVIAGNNRKCTICKKCFQAQIKLR